MSSRFRILQVVTRSPARGLRFAGSEDWGLPVLDVAEDAARLLAAGAEVRVLDQDLEELSDRAVRRQARQWATPGCLYSWPWPRPRPGSPPMSS